MIRQKQLVDGEIWRHGGRLKSGPVRIHPRVLAGMMDQDLVECEEGHGSWERRDRGAVWGEGGSRDPRWQTVVLDS